MPTELEQKGVPDRGDPVVVVNEVSRRFGSRVALDEASLEIPSGQIHALLGPNGAGKTTLIRILVGLVDADAGRVVVAGREGPEMAERSSRRVFGFIPSTDRSFYQRITALENLAFFARLYGLRRRQAVTRARKLLDQVGLADAQDVRVGVYSHGMQKRLAVARALLMSPPVLLVDEATHDLDPEGAQRVRNLILEQARRGAAVLWTTQRVEEIRGFADRVTLLHQGRVRFSGTVPELVSRGPQRWVVELRLGQVPLARAREALQGQGTLQSDGDLPGASPRHLLTIEPGQTLGSALETLVRAGVEVVNCWQESSEIEQAFLALTGEDAT